MVTIASPPAQRVVLYDVSWHTYESLLEDRGENRAPRFFYDRGVLEIVSPLTTAHEETSSTLALLVEVLAEEWSIDVKSVGSMTFKREDLQRAFEPDACFYLQNEERVRGRIQIEPAIDPPPDLVIEIDLSRSSLRKLPVFAAMGVPEVWRYAEARVRIYLLVDGNYVESDVSGALAPLTSDDLTRFVTESRTLRRTAWLRMVREWARTARDQTR